MNLKNGFTLGKSIDLTLIRRYFQLLSEKKVPKIEYFTARVALKICYKRLKIKSSKRTL